MKTGAPGTPANWKKEIGPVLKIRLFQVMPS
jgi:hypothetical protein